ncbi:M56 family metallopeptidase [Cognatilysobacter segetis]|uniref:M56 family metallopeptidase n=1 Tax=Cognatilysobacter segetis TaxID=2492394 RepID=UPI00106196C1|nr:M56 family metallopeptidase [Lysobacter segetis]
MDALAALQFGLAPALATALLHALWQDALLALGAWLALAALARSSASLRHTVAMGFLLAMVLVPASTFLHFWHVPGTQVSDGLLPALTLPRVEAVGGAFVQDSSPVAPWLALAWLAGALLMLLRHAGGWRFVATLDRRPYERLPADWQRRVDVLRLAMGIGRDVAVRLSTDVVGPFTVRVLRPVVWLPLSMLMQLPREQAEALLAHELAHIARLDWLWNGLQCVIESLLFFHPAAWWLGRRIRAEREHACDDLAVAACGDAIALAEALTHLERHRHAAPRLLLAAHGGALMKRITRLISAPPTRGGWAPRAGIAVLAAVGAVLAVQAGVAGSRPGLHIRATTDGVLRPGDMREITARGIDGDRYYRADVDANGSLTEIYKRDGRVQPLDAGARRWVAEVVRLSVPPLPPLPPPPPAPPAPPPPPSLADSHAFRALLRVVASDPGVIARLGTPVALASKDIDGGLNADADGDGDADLRFDLAGPKGRATVRVDATRERGIWSTQRIDVIGPTR